MGALPACVCTVRVPAACADQEQESQRLELELYSWFWESDLGPLEEQSVLFNHWATLQALVVYILKSLFTSHIHRCISIINTLQV